MITKAGKSFKGAAAYYLHDKRQEGEAVRFTDERVGWTRTLNLPTDDPDRAWKLMAMTCRCQAALKAAAGVKATGRKLTNPVFAYSLAYHPDERPTRQQQEKDARDSLKVLGLEEHQAIILSHTDTKHSHVHVIVNRVHPVTGKAATLSNDMLKLSEWAQKHEQEQGKILCPQRVENNARRKREYVAAPRVSRPVYEFNRAVSNDQLLAEFTKTNQRQQDAQLYDIGRQMKTAHARQREALNATYNSMKARAREHTKKLKDMKALEIKNALETKARWRDLFTRQRHALARFEAAERGTLSKLWSICFVYRELRHHNPQADAMTIFYTLVSSAQRRAVFDAAGERKRRELARQIRQEIGAAMKTIEHEAARDFRKLNDKFFGQCIQLRHTHAAQRAELQTKWQARNDDRKQTLGPIRERTKNYRQARHHRRGRSIKDDDLYRRPPQKPDPGQDGGPKMG